MENLDNFIINGTAGLIYQAGKDTADDPVCQLCSHNGTDNTEDSLDSLVLKDIYEQFYIFCHGLKISYEKRQDKNILRSPLPEIDLNFTMYTYISIDIDTIYRMPAFILAIIFQYFPNL
jgi:hypothetical protein